MISFSPRAEPLDGSVAVEIGTRAASLGSYVREPDRPPVVSELTKMISTRNLVDIFGKVLKSRRMGGKVAHASVERVHGEVGDR